VFLVVFWNTKPTSEPKTKTMVFSPEKPIFNHGMQKDQLSFYHKGEYVSEQADIFLSAYTMNK
jgi:hypothetical protein